MIFSKQWYNYKVIFIYNTYYLFLSNLPFHSQYKNLVQ